MKRTQSTAILVAGMHRSGTSATAGALGCLGIALGRNLLQPGADNPKGYWENEEAVRIHERLLHALDRDWDDIRALPADWQQGPAARVAASEIGGLVEADFAGARTWAVKDPRICRFLPLWLDELPRHGVTPTVLVVARSSDEVAASIEKRNGWARPLGILLWLRHVLETEAASRGVRRTAITYEALLEDPARSMSAALARLGVRSRPQPSEDSLQGFVDAGERHHACAQPKRQRTGFAGIADKVYVALSRIGEGQDAWDDVRGQAEAFAAEWDRSGASIDAVADMAGSYRSRFAVCRVQSLELNAKFAAQVQWSEEAVKTHEAVQAERDRIQSDLTAQLRWSEEAVKVHEAVQAERDRLQSELTAQVQWAERAVQTHEAVQAERDRIQSDLTAQLRWSEEAVKVHEAVQAERDRLQSELTAQVQWSEEAVQTHEAVQAERARLQSELTAQLRWSEEAVKVHEAVQAERDRLQSELTAQVQWAERAVQTHEAVQAERARLQSELTAQVRWSEEAVKRQEDLQAEYVRVKLELAGVEAARDALRIGLDNESALRADIERSLAEAERKYAGVLASSSWRLTRPLRAVSGFLGRRPIRG